MSPLGITLLLLTAIVSGFLAAKGFYIIPFGIGAILIGIIILYYCIFKPLIGFYLVTLAAFFYFFAMRLIGQVLPFSTGVELLIFFVFLGTLLWRKPKDETKTNLLKTAISVAIILNFVLILVEAFNPNVDNLGGWVPSFKRYIVCMLVYVTAYRLIDTPSKFRFFVQFWVILTFITALYGFYQQFFGISQFELNFINLQPGAYELMFQGGQLRKMSFLSDVATFGLLCGGMAVFTFLLGLNEKRKKQKYMLFFFALIMEMGMAFSGTRTATIMLPCGLALYGIITIQNKTTVIALFAVFMVAMFVMFAPIYSNLTLNRVRSTFDSKDASLNLRDRNRASIQPYIYAHPIGGGVATTGLEGDAFYPDHPLAGFPPDSGLLKTALELGWVGLILNAFLYLMIFYQGIHYYFRMRNKEYKKFIVVILASLFATIVSLYSQNAVGQFPQVIFIFSCMSLIKRLKEFDDEEENKRLADEPINLNN